MYLVVNCKRVEKSGYRMCDFDLFNSLWVRSSTTIKYQPHLLGNPGIAGFIGE